MSDIEDYIEYIIKKHKKLTTIPPIYVYINRIFFLYQHIYIQSHHKKVLPQDIFYLVCPGVKQKDKINYTKLKTK